MSLRASVAAIQGVKPTLAATDTKHDRRFAQRKPRSLPAYLLSDRLTSAVPVVVRDLSSTGAKLEIVLGRDTLVSSADGLPANLTLHMVADNMEVDISIVWRAGNFIGVRFTSTSRLRPRATTRKKAR